MNNPHISSADEVIEKYAPSSKGVVIALHEETANSYVGDDTVVSIETTRELSYLPHVDFLDHLFSEDWISCGRLIGIAMPCHSGWYGVYHEGTVYIFNTKNDRRYFRPTTSQMGMYFEEVFIEDPFDGTGKYCKPLLTSASDLDSLDACQAVFDEVILNQGNVQPKLN